MENQAERLLDEPIRLVTQADGRTIFSALSAFSAFSAPSALSARYVPGGGLCQTMFMIIQRPSILAICM